MFVQFVEDTALVSHRIPLQNVFIALCIAEANKQRQTNTTFDSIPRVPGTVSGTVRVTTVTVHVITVPNFVARFDRASNSTREWSPCISCIACISPWQTTKQAAICATFWKIEDESNFEEQFLYISARSESPEEAQRRREAELQRKGSEQRGSPQEVESEPRIISSPNLASYDKFMSANMSHVSFVSPAVNPANLPLDADVGRLAAHWQRCHDDAWFCVVKYWRRMSRCWRSVGLLKLLKVYKDWWRKLLGKSILWRLECMHDCMNAGAEDETRHVDKVWQSMLNGSERTCFKHMY